MDSQYIYKTKPNFLFILILAIGLSGSAYMATHIWSVRMHTQGVSETTGYAVVAIFVILLLAFALLCLGLIIGSKVIYLVSDRIIITIPLLFYKREIMLDDIKDMPGAEESIDTSKGLFSDDRTTIGHNTTLLLANGKKVGISSLQVWGYASLIKNIHKQRRIGSGKAHNHS